MPALQAPVHPAIFDGCPEAFQAAPEALSRAWFSTPPRAFVLVADLGGDLDGVATYSLTFSTFTGRPGLWLDDLFIREDFRGRGIGYGLMTELARIAVTEGCGRIEWIVAANNDHGLAFYERQNATISHAVRCARLNQDALEDLASRQMQNG